MKQVESAKVLTDKEVRKSFEIKSPRDCDYCIITKCLDTNAESILIPKTYKGKPIMAIDKYAFTSIKNLKTVDLGIVSVLMKNAFRGCTSLETVTANNPISIGEHAFASLLNLVSVNGKDEQGKQIQAIIKRGAFFGCEKLIDVPYIASAEKEAFFLCSSLKEACLCKESNTVIKNTFQKKCKVTYYHYENEIGKEDVKEMKDKDIASKFELENGTISIKYALEASTSLLCEQEDGRKYVALLYACEEVAYQDVIDSYDDYGAVKWDRDRNNCFEHLICKMLDDKVTKITQIGGNTKHTCYSAELNDMYAKGLETEYNYGNEILHKGYIDDISIYDTKEKSLTKTLKRKGVER